MPFKLKQLLRLYEKITSFQKEILDEQEIISPDSEDFLDPANWIISSQQESNIEIHKVELSGDLLIKSNSEDDVVIQYKPSQSSSFTIFNNVLPGERISIELNGSIEGDVQDVRLMISQRNDQGSVENDEVFLNETKLIDLNNQCDRIIVELHVEGKGSLSIQNLTISRMKGIVSKEIVVQDDVIPSFQPIPKEIKNLKVACIFDVFTMSCYEKDVNLIPITPENCLFLLEQEKPDILIVESAWKGNNGAWEFKIAEYNNHSNDALKFVIKWCKENNVPTVFWNKEDPVHFDRFIKSASLFDVIFTTDENMIPKYKKIVKHDQVYALPFAAQPRLHNPIKIVDKRIGKICFAGSFYDNRHKERRQDMEEILDLSAEFGLDIFDRNYSENQLNFPARFKDNVIGNLPYSQIATAYKGYKIMLNVNSVKYSPTMFSRRVFEGLACGTPIVSTYSEGIKRIFKDLVIISQDKEAFRKEVKKLFENEEHYRAKSLEGIREVLQYHTYKNRIQTICEKSRLATTNRNTVIHVISVVDSADQFNKVLSDFKSQNWKEKQLIIFLKKFDGHLKIFTEYKKVDNISCYIFSYMNQYQNIKQLIPSGYVSYMHPNNFYGENYLLDLGLAIEYSNAEIIGKSAYFKYNNDSNELLLCNKQNEYEYVNSLNSHRSILNVNVIEGENIVSLLSNLHDNIDLSNYFKMGSKLFSSDCYNFIEGGLIDKDSSFVTTVEI